MGWNGDKGLREKKIGTSCLVVCISTDSPAAGGQKVEVEYVQTFIAVS